MFSIFLLIINLLNTITERFFTIVTNFSRKSENFNDIKVVNCIQFALLIKLFKLYLFVL